jgi:hypothetical protein
MKHPGLFFYSGSEAANFFTLIGILILRGLLAVSCKQSPDAE